MAAKKKKTDKTITIDLSNPVPIYDFGKDVSHREVTQARARLTRAYRVFIRTGGKEINPAADLKARQAIYDESVAREAAKKEQERKDYLESQATTKASSKAKFTQASDKKIGENRAAQEAEHKAFLKQKQHNEDSKNDDGQSGKDGSGIGSIAGTEGSPSGEPESERVGTGDKF